jgi:hypothetical protein
MKDREEFAASSLSLRRGIVAALSAHLLEIYKRMSSTLKEHPPRLGFK